MGLEINVSEEALSTARDLAEHLDPRRAASLQGLLLNLIGQVSTSVVGALMQKMLVDALRPFLIDMVKDNDTHVRNQVARLLKANLEAGPLEISIVSMPEPSPRTIRVERDDGGSLKKATITNSPGGVQ